MFRTWSIALVAVSLQIIGMYVWAEAQIVIDPDTKKIYVVSGDTTVSSDDVNSGTTHISGTVNVSGQSNFSTNYIGSGIEETDTNTGSDDTGTGMDIPPTITISTDTPVSEFEQALAWMYDNGLTKYDNASDYRSDDSLIRQEAAKIIGQAYEVLGYTTSAKNTQCSFSDAGDFDPSLSAHITKVCQRELFVGSQGRFMPNDTLTKAQAATVLVRMLEGRKSDEDKSPRWSDYYKKSKAIGLTMSKEADFDTPISRRDVAIFVYRIRNIVSNEQLKVLSLNSMYNAVNTDKNNQQSNLLAADYTTIAENISVTEDPELQEAINWMYDNGLTTSKTIDEYKPFDLMLREQAAKVITSFAGLYGEPSQLPNVPSGACSFEDSGSIDTTLLSSVNKICSMGLLLGTQGKFRPKDPLTKANFVVSLMRLLQGKHLDESVQPWWKNYYELALQLDIIGPADAVTFDQPITRYEVALFLYRFKVKYLLLKNLNNSRLQNEIITTLSGSVQTGVTGMPESQVYINTVALSNTDFTLGYMETFGNRYKLVKTTVENYYTNNFVWYGDVFTIDNDTKIGTIALIVSNGLVVEGNVRFTDRDHDYLITPVTATQAYYALRTVARQR